MSGDGVMIVYPKGSIQLIVVAIYGTIEILGLRVDKERNIHESILYQKCIFKYLKIYEILRAFRFSKFIIHYILYNNMLSPCLIWKGITKNKSYNAKPILRYSWYSIVLK